MNWGIGLFLLLCAGAGLFLAFRSPGFVAGLIAVAVRAMLPSLAAIFHNKPKSEAEWREQREKADRVTHDSGK